MSRNLSRAETPGVLPPRLTRRAGVVVLLSALGVLLGTAPAWAHSRLETSDPPNGASVAAPPKTVALTFNEDVQGGFTVITVIGPDGKDYHSGAVTEVDRTVSVGVLPLGPAGVYQIGYRVVSADGHPVSGSTSFTLTAPGPGSPAAAAPVSGAPAAAVPDAAPPDSGGGAPVWPWIVGAVVLVAAGVAAALRLSRAA